MEKVDLLFLSSLQYMAVSDRILHLEQLLAEDPNDPFLHYARCLEYAKLDLLEAKPYWEIVLDRFPDYVPAYYQAGMCFFGLLMKDRAIQIWKKGVEIAGIQNDRHAQTELKSILQNALIDDDD